MDLLGRVKLESVFWKRGAESSFLNTWLILEAQLHPGNFRYCDQEPVFIVTNFFLPTAMLSLKKLRETSSCFVRVFLGLIDAWEGDSLGCL